MQLPRFPVLLIFFFFNALIAKGESWDQAEQLFRGGDVKAAHEKYLEYFKSANRTEVAALAYNVGSTALNKGDAALAYSYLTKARFANPFDKDIQHNQAAAKAKLSMAAAAISPTSWFGWWPEYLRFLPSGIYGLFFLLSSAAFLACLLKNIPQGKVLLGSMSLITLMLFVTHFLQTRDPIISTLQTSVLKSGPGASFSDIAKIEAGSLLSLEEVRETWAKVRFQTKGNSEDIVGWIEKSSTLPIR